MNKGFLSPKPTVKAKDTRSSRVHADVGNVNDQSGFGDQPSIDMDELVARMKRIKGNNLDATVGQPRNVSIAANEVPKVQVTPVLPADQNVKVGVGGVNKSGLGDSEQLKGTLDSNLMGNNIGVSNVVKVTT